MKTVESSLAAYLRGRLEKSSGHEDDFSLRDLKALATSTALIKSSRAVLIGRDSGSGLLRCGRG